MKYFCILLLITALYIFTNSSNTAFIEMAGHVSMFFELITKGE